VIQYKGTYTDSSGTVGIIVSNDFENFLIEIDGVRFEGRGPGDLAIIDKTIYDPSQLKRFSFFSISLFQSNETREILCNCSFKLALPQLMMDRKDNTIFETDLNIEYILGKELQKSGSLEYENIELQLVIAEKIIKGSGGFIELAFDQIRDKLKDEYQFKNCYGCMFGDYSVFGQNSFGTMLCFANQKDQYNKVINKDEYMELLLPDRQVQEIYCCDQYEPRKPGSGYRG
jgi:hypothetical protein